MSYHPTPGVPVGAPGVARRPRSVVVSASFFSVLAVLALVYSLVTWFVIWSIPHAYTGPEMVGVALSNHGSGARRIAFAFYVSSPPIFFLWLIASALSVFSGIARGISAFLAFVAVVMLIAMFTVYLLTPDFLNETLTPWMYFLAWAYPLLVAVLTIAAAPSVVMGWRYFAERSRSRSVGASNRPGTYRAHQGQMEPLIAPVQYPGTTWSQGAPTQFPPARFPDQFPPSQSSPQAPPATQWPSNNPFA